MPYLCRPIDQDYIKNALGPLRAEQSMPRPTGLCGTRLCGIGHVYGLVYGHACRADWELGATSRKCMAGVPGVIWRSPAVLWGPSTPNSSWVLRKTHTFKNWPIFLYACGNGVNLPHFTKHAFRDKMGPNVQNPMPFGSPSHQGPKNCELSQKMF